MPKRLVKALAAEGIILGVESRFTFSLTLTRDKTGKLRLTAADWEIHAPHYRKSRQGRRPNVPDGYVAIHR
ncbi:MAG: hypothetical protein ABSD99_07215 [Candidatus Bathyarchaeia archaeon]